MSRLRLELPLPVYFHAVTVSKEGKMVMFGGVDSIEQNTRTNKVKPAASPTIRLSPCVQVFTSWLTVPSLKSMAWEAVCHYTPHIAQLSQVGEASTSSTPDLPVQAALLAEGVPSGCLETLASPATQAACG